MGARIESHQQSNNKTQSEKKISLLCTNNSVDILTIAHAIVYDSETTYSKPNRSRQGQASAYLYLILRTKLECHSYAKWCKSDELSSPSSMGPQNKDGVSVHSTVNCSTIKNTNAL